MERRIFGLETEYGVTCTYRGQRRLSPDEVGLPRIGHFGFFRASAQESLWEGRLRKELAAR